MDLHCKKRIQDLKIDVVIPAGHSANNLFHKEVDEGEWIRMCDGAIQRMQKQL